MPKHAYLSASASHRWLACPPSAKLCAGINDSGSPYAQQGTDAHALCEYKVEKLMGRNPKDPTENLTWFDTEMDDCTDQYAAYVAEQIEEAKTHCSDPLILIEEKLDFSKWVPEGFGTGDCVISMVADFQDPVDMIPKYVHEWENGYKIVIGIKKCNLDGC